MMPALFGCGRRRVYGRKKSGAAGVMDGAARRLGRMSYTETDVERLGERLASIDLAQGERAALDALMTFAARTPSEIEALASGNCPDRYKTVLPEILFDSEPAQN